uniref:Wall-associated receptor kinase galacturonan-binding domain-containing protein n=2 Tax=Aegilops tauschii subsp. strangulata TaxID=200361 RepID=A0A453DSH4_AEGTS
VLLARCGQPAAPLSIPRYSNPCRRSSPSSSCCSPAAGAACSPKTCGELNITYPFWLEEGAGRPPCGSPSFQLKCNGSHAFLSRSMLGKYQVARVFAENSSRVAVNHNLLVPPRAGCPPWWFNISLGLGLGPYTISKKNREVLVLYNFTKQQKVASPHALPRRVLLPPWRGGEYGSHRGLADLPPACNLSVVPVLGFPDGDNGYLQSMRQGFLLEWTVPQVRGKRRAVQVRQRRHRVFLQLLRRRPPREVREQ